MNEQRYELSIKRFIESVDYQSKKLETCIGKINEYQSYEDWQNVKQAEINASQIIKRIKSDIKEMEKLRAQILAELDDKQSNQIVNKIDEQLKIIAKRLERQIEAIDSINAPYYSFEIRNQNRNIL